MKKARKRINNKVVKVILFGTKNKKAVHLPTKIREQ